FAAAAGPVALGPVAALAPVKHLASVGGGFFAANSAHPFENPCAWTNLLSLVGILLFPCAVVVMFRRIRGRGRPAAVLYTVMLGQLRGPRANPGRGGLAGDQEGTGNLEGKELRFGQAGAAAFVAATTAVGCGSVNCMHDSLNPLAQLTPLVGMWLNCVFGGK